MYEWRTESSNPFFDVFLAAVTGLSSNSRRFTGREIAKDALDIAEASIEVLNERQSAVDAQRIEKTKKGKKAKS